MYLKPLWIKDYSKFSLNSTVFCAKFVPTGDFLWRVCKNDWERMGLDGSPVCDAMGTLNKRGLSIPKLLHMQQVELDLEDGDAEDGVEARTRLMSTLDAINDRYGKGTMAMASTGLDGDHRVWTMRQERRTPAYTTCIADMPIARADLAPEKRTP